MNIRNIWIGLAMASGMLAASTVPSAAVYTESVKYSFCSSASCADGAGAQMPLLRDGNKYYGTTFGQGANGQGGVVFRYNANTGVYTVLYSFCAVVVGTVCTDGATPVGRLIIDTNGNLYGTTKFGGAYDFGTVYELKKPASGPWTIQTLYSFCPSSGCVDGSYPFAGVSYAGAAGGSKYDGTSLLFGTTLAGGNDTHSTDGHGVMFALQNTSGAWAEKVIHNFCAGCTDTCTSCSDGIQPDWNIVIDAADNIWGTASSGGSNAKGIAYELTPGANLWASPWTETILYNFCWANGSKCPDGSTPNGVILDASGNIFATSFAGGGLGGFDGSGALVELTNGSCTEGGMATFWCDTVLYSFCHSSGCPDGNEPAGYIAMDASGNIFGSTDAGGTSTISGGAGLVWEYNGTTTAPIYKFCPAAGCSDGQYPFSGVILDASGDLWGTTNRGGGGSPADGVIFELTP